MIKNSSNTYPFVKCLHPQVIINKYTHEKMMVSCGKCEACLSRKSSMSTLKCRMESSNHKYAKFITLTYDDAHIPRMAAALYDKIKNGVSCSQDYFKPYIYVELEPRIDGVRRQVMSPFEERSTHYSLTNKVENRYLPYLCKRDLQLFIKRLRRTYERLSKKYNIPFGEIRYFACGEYGPVHFRPHYHIILWYSEEEINKTIQQVVSSCWKLGRFSVETPRDDVSKYVAKYVNGNQYLPDIYKSSKIKPFSVHSQHLGEKIFRATRKEVYESSIEEIIRKRCFINGTYTDVYMWRSLKTFYFPRCKAFDLCSSQLRLYSYTIKAKAVEIFGKKNNSELTRCILGYFNYMTKFNILHVGQWHQDPNTNDFFKYFIRFCDIAPLHLENVDYYKSAFRSVYMVLRLSSHFIEFVCDGVISRANSMLIKIEDFYSKCDYFNLKNQYSDLEMFCEDWFDDEEEYKLCFTLYPDSICQTSIYKKYRSNVLNSFANSMKHKKQNDLNRIFENLK